VNKVSPTADQGGVFFVRLDSVELGVAQHPDIQICVSQPADSFFDVGHCAENHLCTELVSKLRDHLTFDW